ncbi:transcription-repair coupling factor [Chloroflexota bacterium]
MIRKLPAYRQLVRELSGNEGLHKAVVPRAAQPYVLAALHLELSRLLVLLVPTAEDAQRLYLQIPLWSDNPSGVVLFPEPDALPYEHLVPDSFIEQQRLQVLAALVQSVKAPGVGASAPLIVTSANAAVRKTLSRNEFLSASHTVRQGMRADPLELLKTWDGMGYRRTEMVEVPGTMSQRGGILDVYPPNSERPARIEFFGSEVESIRLFNALTQRSLELVSALEVVPAVESVGSDSDTLIDYLPPECLVIVVEPEEVETSMDDLDFHAGQLRESLVEKGELAGDFPVPYLTFLELGQRLGSLGQGLTLTRWPRDDTSAYELAFSPAPSYGGQLAMSLTETKEQLRRKRRVVVVSQQAARLAELLYEEDILVSPCSSLERTPDPGTMALVQGSLSEGWKMGKDLLVLTDAEIFGYTKQPRLTKPRPVQHKALLPDLSPGDYAVHVEHGIGRFAGMTKLRRDGVEREYLVLEYASGDRLYVPIDQADRISRYVGAAGKTPSLSRLGTHEWERVKKRVKESAREMARELLDLYAAREVVPGSAFSPDTMWQQELEASFPYVETPDQIEVVEQVKADMEEARPMDRLVCGDVGYGKTEVALRAAFKTVMDGKQVAMLVPTTVLAQQHFTTFADRLAAFPVRVEMLSRFRSEREQEAVVAGLGNGSVDICIGTHRLIQGDVVFKDLGLVIIDEEQRFGVGHKERLRHMRREVDVLTLSATPIPRTLHMSLVGVRDMSTMETPPEERLPIKTCVAEYNEAVIREAIIREMERKRQVFFVHNRVHSIDWVARRLRDLVPEARIAVAHGQMSEDKLERAMLDFIQGEDDVLVCTTIIESGLDIPNVNTLIVNDADKLGLAQLYQLRGRVGRGNNRAYAYFLYSRGKHLSEAAERRLQTIFDATELGSGFRIALKDLEIRGAGNLLGPEQSGHIATVGFALYCQLLSEAVEELKSGQRKDEAVDLPEHLLPIVELSLSAYISEDYVADINTRLDLYQRLARARSAGEVNQMGEELRDRFGSPPPEVDDLLYVVSLRALAARAGIQSISREGRHIVVRLWEGLKIDRERLTDFHHGLTVGTSQLRLDISILGKKWRSVLQEVVEVLLADGC